MTDLEIKSNPDRQLLRRTEEQLRNEYMIALSAAVDGFKLAAELLREMERRGADTSEMPLSTYISRIARGMLAPEAMLRFLGNALLLRHVARLPLEDQRRLAAGEPVALALPGGATRSVDPLQLPPGEVRQVFAADHIRSEAEQAHWIDHRQNQAKAIVSIVVPGVRVDRRARRIVITEGTSLSVQQLMAFVSELAR